MEILPRGTRNPKWTFELQQPWSVTPQNDIEKLLIAKVAGIIG